MYYTKINFADGRVEVIKHKKMLYFIDWFEKTYGFHTNARMESLDEMGKAAIYRAYGDEKYAAIVEVGEGGEVVK